MSVVGLFNRARPSIGGFLFDAVLEESSELQTEVTEFPVESGTVGNDHAADRPLRITMRVGMSNNAFRAAAADAGQFAGGAGAVIGTAAGASIGQLSGSTAAAAGLAASVANAAYAAGSASTRSLSALEAVREIQRAKELVDVIGGKGQEYTGCLITNTRQETNKENENGLELVVEMKQLLIIDMQRRDRDVVAAPDDPAATIAPPTRDFGLVVPR